MKLTAKEVGWHPKESKYTPNRRGNCMQPHIGLTPRSDKGERKKTSIKDKDLEVIIVHR